MSSSSKYVQLVSLKSRDKYTRTKMYIQYYYIIQYEYLIKLLLL